MLRLDPEVYNALQIWARDELRSLNAQIDFLLRRNLESSKRLKSGSSRGSQQGKERGKKS